MKKISVLMAIGVMILGFSVTSVQAQIQQHAFVTFTEYSSTVLTATVGVGGPDIGTVQNIKPDEWFWTPPGSVTIGAIYHFGIYWQEPESTNTTILGNVLTHAGEFPGGPLGIISDNDFSFHPENSVPDGSTVIGYFDVSDGTLYDVQFIDKGDATTAVPEPCTMLLFGGGLVGLVAYRMRSNKA